MTLSPPTPGPVQLSAGAGECGEAGALQRAARPPTTQREITKNLTAKRRTQGMRAQELSSFLRVQTSSEMVVDRSTQGDLLRISFNISFPSLSCEFATLDVSDALGTKRLNLTKTIRKLPIGQVRCCSGQLLKHFNCIHLR